MFHILYLKELITIMSALWLEKGGRGEEKGTGGERQTDRQRLRLTCMIQKVKYQRACQGVTHAPQGFVMQGLPPSHSCLLSGTHHWAGVCQIFIFISSLLTVKTARRSACLSKAECFHLKYLGAWWIQFVQIMTLALTKKNWYWDTGDLLGFWGNLVDYNLVATATQQQGKLQELNIWREVF